MSSIVKLDANGRPIPKGSKTRPAKYRARWRTPEGDSRSQTFARMIDAERHLASVTITTAEGNYVDTSAGRTMFGKYAEQWAAAQPHRATTADGVERILRLHILPTFARRPIASIRTSEVQAWVSGLDMAPSSTAVAYGKLVAVFNAAVEDRLITRSPCTRRVRLPRADGAEVVPMSPAQVAALVAISHAPLPAATSVFEVVACHQVELNGRQTRRDGQVLGRLFRAVSDVKRSTLGCQALADARPAIRSRQVFVRDVGQHPLQPLLAGRHLVAVDLVGRHRRGKPDGRHVSTRPPARLPLR